MVRNVRYADEIFSMSGICQYVDIILATTRLVAGIEGDASGYKIERTDGSFDPTTELTGQPLAIIKRRDRM